MRFQPLVLACVAILAACSPAPPPTETELVAVDTLFADLADFSEFADGDITEGGPCPFDVDGRLLIEGLAVLCVDDDAVVDNIGHRVTRGVTAYSLDEIERRFVEDGFDAERRDDDGEWLLVQRGSRVVGITTHTVSEGAAGLVVLRVSEAAHAEKLMPRFQGEVTSEASSWVRSLSSFTFRSLLATAD